MLCCWTEYFCFVERASGVWRKRSVKVGPCVKNSHFVSMVFFSELFLSELSTWRACYCLQNQVYCTAVCWDTRMQCGVWASTHSAVNCCHALLMARSSCGLRPTPNWLLLTPLNKVGNLFYCWQYMILIFSDISCLLNLQSTCNFIFEWLWL